MDNKKNLKIEVKDFWDEKSCGEIYAVGQTKMEYYESHRKARYALEPYIFDFAKFNEGSGKDVLEIGVGMGADHIEWAKSSPKSLTGIDLTPKAIKHTGERLSLYGLKSDITVADAESLVFDDNSFDLVYSWGVLHHSPNTPQAINEVFRVLRPSGIARIMIYYKYSIIGYLLWARYGLLTGHPFRSLAYIFSNYMESPGTKAYSISEAKKMFSQFTQKVINVKLSFGDLFDGAVGQRHSGILLTVAKKIWPKKLIKILFRNYGSMLLIEARK